MVLLSGKRKADIIIEVANGGKSVSFTSENKGIKTDGLDRFAVKELEVSGCFVEDFSFLSALPNVEKLIILDCKSDAWQRIPIHENIRILRLHTLRNMKTYHDNVDFITGFPNIEYLYLNNLDIEKFPNTSHLKKLLVVCCSLRKCTDYSTLENAPSLSTFIGWSAVDRHRTAAETFIPILNNPSLKAFSYTQAFNIENRKLDEYIRTHRPDITYPMVTTRNGDVDISKIMVFINMFF